MHLLGLICWSDAACLMDCAAMQGLDLGVEHKLMRWRAGMGMRSMPACRASHCRPTSLRLCSPIFYSPLICWTRCTPGKNSSLFYARPQQACTHGALDSCGWVRPVAPSV